MVIYMAIYGRPFYKIPMNKKTIIKINQAFKEVDSHKKSKIIKTQIPIPHK